MRSKPRRSVTPETKNSGQRCANCDPGLETGQPPGRFKTDTTVIELGRSTRSVREGEPKKSPSTETPILFGLSVMQRVRGQLTGARARG